MRQKFATAPIVALLFAVSACDPGRPASDPVSSNESTKVAMKDVQEVQSRIERIATDVRDLNTPDDLFDLKAFTEIYENPMLFSQAAGVLCARPDVALMQKKILALSMQRLQPLSFFRFINGVIDGVEQGSTSVSVLELAAFPPLNWGLQTLITHYDAPEAQAVLKRIEATPQVSERTRRHISEMVLTGKAREELQAYREMTGARP